MQLGDTAQVLAADTRGAGLLTAADLPALQTLYAAAYPGNWFDSRMLGTGQYVGIWQGDRLMAVAGIHVYSPSYKIAALGNITTHSLQEIWHNHPTLQGMRKRRTIPMQQVPGCADCEWVSYCNGSCPGLPHQLTGDLNRANHHDCYRRFLLEKETVHAE